MNGYFTVAGYAETEWEIERSKFITFINRVENEESAYDFIDTIRKKHWNATHHCTAFIIGEEGRVQKADDDGEPGGTAGKPILEVIKRENLRNTVIVVTRYFGGIKLGAGGLIRAYGKSASLGIKAAGIVEQRVYSRFKIVLDYSFLGKFENKLLNNGFVIAELQFCDHVAAIVLAERKRSEELNQDIMDVSAGSAMIEYDGEQYLELPV